MPDVGTLNSVTTVKRADDHWDAWAAGDNGILHYDSTNLPGNWSVASGAAGANAVAARTTNDVWAVGNTIQHWDGSAWSVITPGPSPIPTGVTFTGISLYDLNGNHDLRAVGYTGTVQSQNRRPFVLRKTGNTWTYVIDPSGVGTDSYLNSIDVFDANYAWAVGSYFNTIMGRYRALIEHWNGVQWTRVEGTNIDAGITFNELHSVVLNGAGDVWADGAFSNSGVLPPPLASLNPLVLHWGDQGWDRVTVPNAGTGSQLLGITTIPGGGAVLTRTWAVGNDMPPAPNTTPQTLIEEIKAPEAPPHTTSYYITELGPAPGKPFDPWEMGCAARQNDESGIIILDFGQPRNWGTAQNPQYGTLLLNGLTTAYIANPNSLQNDITQAGNQFSKGFHDCGIPGWTRPITLALGINNYNTDGNASLTAGHAQAWASMVDNVYSYAKQFPEVVDVVGAIDAEPNFAPQDPNNPNIRYFDYPPDNSTYTWAKNYFPHLAHPYYYNFGSTDGYPGPSPAVAPPGLCCSGWQIDQIYEISFGLPFAYVIPEIYKPPYARDWHRVARWSIETQQKYPLVFSGVMSDCRAVGGTGCTQYMDANGQLGLFHFKHDQAWQVFWLELNTDPQTRQELSWSTDIRWSDR